MILGGLQKTTLVDYPGKVACTVFTSGCNFKCGYCHNPELQKNKAVITEEEFFSFLREKKGKLDAVVISGGEPTIHTDLIEFAKKIKTLGFLVKLDTQGSNPSMLQRLIENRVLDYIAMDIKAPYSKYQLYVNNPNILGRVKKSIDIIMNSGINYEFRTTIVKEDLSIDDLEEIAKSIKGANMYYLQQFMPTNTLNKDYMNKSTYDMHILENLAQKFTEYVACCSVR